MFSWWFVWLCIWSFQMFMQFVFRNTLFALWQCRAINNLTTTNKYEYKFYSMKCNMESLTSYFWKRYCRVDKPNHHYSVLTEILLKKVRCRMCDPLSPVDRPNLHIYRWIEILLKKCDVECVTLRVQLQNKPKYTSI